MAQGTIAPFPKHVFLTNAGLPAAGYQLFSYEAGTTTKLLTYSDADLAIGHSNGDPIVLDSAGRATIFLLPQSYKFVLASPTDTDPPASPIWTVDNVSATSQAFQAFDIEGVAGEDLTAGNGVYVGDGIQGGTVAGRWYRWDADNTYSSTSASMLGMVQDDIASGDTGRIRLVGRITGLVGLTASSTYFISGTAGGVTLTAPTNSRIAGVADSSTSLLVGFSPAHLAAGATNPGFVSTAIQVWEGEKTFLDQPLYVPGAGAAGGGTGALGGLTHSNFVDVGNVGSGEDDLMTRNIPADWFDTTTGKGTVIHIVAHFEAAANTPLIAFYWNSVQIGTDHTMNAAASSAIAEVWIYRTGQDTQEVILKIDNNIGGDNADHNLFFATASANEEAQIPYKFTGEGTNNNDIIQKALMEWVY